MQIYKMNSTGPLILKDYMKLIRHDGHGIFLGVYIQSKFQDFESYLRSKSDLAEVDIELILKQYKLNFITYEIALEVHTTVGKIDYFDRI